MPNRANGVLIGRHNMKLFKGFTFIETTVVLVIIAFISAFSFPFFAKYLNRTKLESASRDITSTLRVARSYAITQNSEYLVRFEFDGSDYTGFYWIAKASTPNTPDKKLKLPQAVTFQTISFGTDITFDPRGALTSGIDSQITLRHKNNKEKIIDIYATTGTVKVK